MNTNNTKHYFVGREIDNEFWCKFETDSLEKAQDFLQKKMEENVDKSCWCIYEKQISYRLIESCVQNESKEEKLTKAMVAAM